MLLAVVLSVLLVAVAADDDHHVEHHEMRGGPLRMAAGLAARVDKLESGVTAARAKAPEFIKRAKAVEARVHAMEDDGCDHDRSFQCGGYERHCISDLLVCDGNNDCMDGQDEDEDLCHTRVPVGSIFEGHLARRSQSGCGGDIRDVRMSIVWSQRLSWFQSRQKVKAAITLTSGDGTELGAVVRGYYNYRLKTVILLPMDDLETKLAFTCTFDGVQDDRCLASARSGDMKPCITFGMKKIH